MPNLKEVKNRIQSVMSTQQITKAMKMVAAAKLRRAQDSIIKLRPYANKLNGVLQNLAAGSSGQDDNNVFAEKRDVEKVLLIVITSDRGLCGAFNSNIGKATIQHIKENYKSINDRGDLTILTLGKKGMEYLRKRKYKINNDFWEVFADLSFANATKSAVYAMKAFAKGEYDKVEIIYNEFKNVATQIIRKEQFLPITIEETEDVSDIDYIYQPDREEIYEELVPKSLKLQLFKALLESNASEQGARMTAMDQATDNAGELLKELRLTYNRTRQAAITTELTEIVAGAQALEG